MCFDEKSDAFSSGTVYASVALVCFQLNALDISMLRCGPHGLALECSYLLTVHTEGSYICTNPCVHSWTPEGGLCVRSAAWPLRVIFFRRRSSASFKNSTYFPQYFDCSFCAVLRFIAMTLVMGQHIFPLRWCVSRWTCASKTIMVYFHPLR